MNIIRAINIISIVVILYIGYAAVQELARLDAKIQEFSHAAH